MMLNYWFGDCYLNISGKREESQTEEQFRLGSLLSEFAHML